MASAGGASWSALLPHVIDDVVAALKRHHRWLYDGPSLRALNRHWCRALSSNVTEIHPHPSRQISPDDVKSLYKFPRANSVDASAFCPSDATEDDCDTVVQELARMKSLSRLVLGTIPASLAFLASSSLAELSRVTSLRIEPRPRASKSIPDEMLNLLNRLPLEGILLEGAITDLGIILENAPALKRLTVNEHTVTPSDAVVQRLQALEWISFQLTSIRIDQLAALSSLVCVGVDIQPEDIATVACLLQIESLTLRLLPSGATTLNLDALQKLSKMTSLTLVPLSNDRRLCELGVSLAQLQRMIVTKFQLCGTQFRDYLKNLKIFGATDCMVFDSEAFLLAFQNVERFCLLHVATERGGPLNPSWTPATFPKLSVVCAQIYDAEAIAGMDALLSMTQLEKMSLTFAGDGAFLRWRFFPQLQKLDRLTALRELTIDEFGSVEEVNAFIELDVVTQLEVLAIDLDPIGSEKRDEVTKAIQTKAPRLKLSTTWRDVVNTVIQWSLA